MTEFSPEQRMVLTSTDGTVQLRQLVPEDAQAYFDLVQFDPEHFRQVDEPTADKYPTSDSVREGIEDPEEPDKLRFGIWALDGASGPAMVGSVNLTPMDTEAGTAAVGWWVGARHTGHGYAARAVQPLLDYAFGTMNLNMVFCKILTRNEASLRTAENAGFEYRSTSEADVATYAITRERFLGT
jgi:RimJ/RimL family protein N-acetyltransferase